MPVEVGQRAPDFTLKSGDNDDVSLGDFRGKRNVVLVFYPAAFSGFCTDQLTAIAANEGRYVSEDAQIIGVLVDNRNSNRAFAEQLGLTDAILLSDFEPKGAVAREYGVYLDGPGLAGRATFVIDLDRRVLEAFSSELDMNAHADRALAALRSRRALSR